MRQPFPYAPGFSLLQLLCADSGGPAFPNTLAELNTVFAPWGASFSHAWNFNEASGNAIDLSTSDPVPLVPQGSPTQGVSTGLINGDKGVQMTDGSSARMECGDATDLDITTGDLIVLLTTRPTALPAADRNLFTKVDATTYRVLYRTNGHMNWDIYDGASLTTSTAAADHSGTAYVDVLCVLDRAAGADTQRIFTNLATGATVTPSALTISNAGKFQVGGLSNTAAPQIATFCAWGTVPGSLIANGAAAITAWRKARGA